MAVQNDFFLITQTTVAATETRYTAFASGGFTNSGTTEAQSNIPWRTVQTFSNFRVWIASNGLTASSTVRLRKNAANVTSTVSITSGGTGEFTDTTHTDTIAAGDLLGVSMVAGGTGTNMVVQWIGASTNVQEYRAVNGWGAVGTLSASTTYYFGVQGLGTETTTEDQAEITARDYGTFRDLCARVATNTNAAAATLRSRKNGANGAQSASITAGTTGTFQDISNTDSIAPGDTFNYSYTTGTGAVGGLMSWCSTLQFKGKMPIGSQGTTTLSAGVTSYFGIWRVNNGTSEADRKFDLKGPAFATNLGIYISANASSGTSTYTLRKNGADGNNTVSWGAGATGWFEDTTNTDTFASGDTIGAKVVAASGGSQTVLMAVLHLAFNYTMSSAVTNVGDTMSAAATYQINVSGAITDGDDVMDGVLYKNIFPPGYIKSLTPFSITIASGSTSNTATISAVGSKAFIWYQGQSASGTNFTSSFGYCELTNNTTVTAVRNSSNSDTLTINGVVIDPEEGLVEMVQAGKITITSGTSNTATINAVDPTRTAILYLGNSTAGSNPQTTAASVVLTNPTTVTANINSNGTVTVSYVALTLNRSAIKSYQAVSITTDGTSPDTTTIASVTTANTLIAWGGFIANGGNTGRYPYTVLTNGTTLTTTYNGASQYTIKLGIIEFNPGVLQNMQRGTITHVSDTSKTATISSAPTDRSFVNYLGTNLGTQPNTANNRLTLTNPTTVTADVGASSTSIVSYEVPTFATHYVTGALFEGRDTMTASATNTPPIDISVSGAITEHGDTMTASATETFIISGAITERGDTVAGVMTETFIINGAITEGRDTAAGVVNEIFSISAAVTEQGDTMTATGTETFIISGSITEQGDTFAGVGVETFIINGSITERGDTASASINQIYQISGAITEGRDTMSASGQEIFIINAAITETGDTMSAAGTVSFSITGSITEAGDVMTASATETFIVNGSVTEGRDIMQGTAATADNFMVNGAVTERGDTMTAAAVETFILTGAITEGRDNAAAIGIETYSGAGAILEQGDTAAAVLVETYRISGAITEQGDTISGSAQVINRISAAVTEGGDVMSGAGIVIEGNTISGAVTEGGDTATGAVLIVSPRAGIRLKGYLMDSPSLPGYNLSNIPLSGYALDDIVATGDEP